MKRKKKVSIVGSGITGLSAALIFLKKDMEVEIFEKGDLEGGIIQDISVDKKNYLSGCQYLSTESFWYKNVPQKIKRLLRLEDVNYMSYCDLFNNKDKCLDNFADVHIDRKIRLSKLKTKQIENLYDKLSLFPDTISKVLENWSNRFKVDLKKLTPDSHRNGYMFSRIFLKKNNEIKRLKNSNKIVDDLYGIPRAKNFVLKGLLPVKGYNEFFKEFSKYLKEKKININLKTPVVPIWKEKKIFLKSKGKLIESDYVLWTGNPVSLIKEFNNSLLESANMKLRNMTFKANGKISTDFYIQVYTKKSSILRLFVYKKNKNLFCSVECLNESEDFKKIKKDANIILKSFNKKICLVGDKIFDITQKRYSVLSIKDYKILRDFKNKILDTNLIPSPWEFASSEKRLNILESTLKDIK